MFQILKKCILLLLIAVPVFAQSNAEENEPFWRQALGGFVLSLPDVQVQSAVVALDGGNIRAYSTAGTPMWNYYARGRISPFVTRSREGTSYFSRTNGTLIAVNRAGRELWQYNLGSPLCAKVIPGWDSRIFAPTDKKIFCLTASGNLLWTRNFESSFSVAPKLDKTGGILFALENNDIYHIDPFGKVSRRVLQKPPIALLSVESPHETGSGSASPEYRIITVYTDGTMELIQYENISVSAHGGTLSAPIPRLPSTPVAAISRGNKIAAVSDDGTITFISLEENRIIWSGDSHIKEVINKGRKPELEAEMLFDERGVYVLSKDGASGFTHDGRRLWFSFLYNAAAIPAFGNDGVLYSGGLDWILYAYKIEDRILPDNFSIYGPVPEGAYGTGHFNRSYIPGIPYFEFEIKPRLDQIESGIKAGMVGENELAWISFLMSVADSKSPIQHRVSAVRLLGQIGSQETIPWFVYLFRKEADPAVKATIAAAIGSIGVDPDGVAIDLFFNSIGPVQGMHDSQVLTAIAAATGALCRFSGPPLSLTGIRILLMLSTDIRPIMVSRQAKRELASLR
ncbi:MAG: PQQ-binding-like beta-propeller repeat protein [Treponema sp.]|nr:PQQ-binding-like beta-propeller repeat protein [Treponema sp.]